MFRGVSRSFAGVSRSFAGVSRSFTTVSNPKPRNDPCHARGYKQGLGKRGQGALEVDAWNLKPLPPRRGLGHRIKKTSKPKDKRILYARIDLEGNHTYGYIKRLTEPLGNKFQVAEISPLGRPRVTEQYIDLDFTPAEVLWWGPTVMGPAEVTYPHPQGWRIDSVSHPTPLDQLNVKRLTALFRSKYESHPSCMVAWPKRLGGLIIPWTDLARLMHSPLTTNKDIHSWFKNILHRALATRSLVPSNSCSRCRLCGITFESILHIASCPSLNSTFNTLIDLIESTTTSLRVEADKLPLKLFGCTTHNNELRPLPPGLFSLMLILWTGSSSYSR